MDKGALTGLRGLFAFHVMAFHAFLFMPQRPPRKLYIFLFANIDMPLFFLLSGFSLSLGYGKMLWDRSTKRCLGCKSATSNGVEYSENAGENREMFDTWKFYKKRLIRILPLHYLGIVAGLIEWRLGQYSVNAGIKDMAIGSILSMFAVNTWVLPYENVKPPTPHLGRLVLYLFGIGAFHSFCPEFKDCQTER